MRKLWMVCMLFFTGQLFAQVADVESTPYSLSHPAIAAEIDQIAFFKLPAIDLAALKKEDEITDQHKDIPFRFGEVVEVNINLTNSGKWIETNDGYRMWMMKIQAEGARSVNLNFKRFQLAAGSQLHIYSPDYSSVLGAFTNANNREDSLFATTLLSGEYAILEYREPISSNGSIIELGSVVHGYRGFNKRGEGLDDSGPCNININCPEGADWQNQKRSVVMVLLANNSRVCSGTLINNEKVNGRPFVLTANHCPIGPNNIFVFNYDSPVCQPSSQPSTLESMNGCRELASNSSFFASDFNLVELLSIPPASYNVYYSGWSNLDVPSQRSVGIHHPRGDVKKIAVDDDPVVSSGYYVQGDSHWAVLKWNKGTTEDASSGSALFNEQRRVVGQLHGGDASCRNDTVDFYGKFAHSWDMEADSTRQLKYWLDPNQTGIEVLDGFDPAIASLPSPDAQLAGLGMGNGTICGDSIYPIITIRNLGSTQLSAAIVEINLDGKIMNSLNWSGSLALNQMDQLVIPAIAVETGNHILSARISSVNGTTDVNPINDYLTQRFFSVSNPTEITLTLKTDDFGNETKWQLINALGNVVESFSNYPGVTGGRTYTHQFCLYPGCYRFTIFDTFGDGFCCGSGSGFYLLTNTLSGDTIAFNNTFSDNADTSSFCVADSCTILLNASIKNVSEGGKSDGSIGLEVTAGNPPFQFNWSTGASSNTIENLSIGSYSVTITDSLGCSSTFSFEVQLSTGLELTSNGNNFMIYPNPSNGELILTNLPNDLKKIKITLLELSGKALQKKTIIRSNSAEIRVELSEVKAGMYLLLIEGNSSFSAVRKIILE